MRYHQQRPYCTLQGTRGGGNRQVPGFNGQVRYVGSCINFLSEKDGKFSMCWERIYVVKKIIGCEKYVTGRASLAQMEAPQCELTLWETFPSVPRPDTSLCQALTRKKRWEQKQPTTTIFTAKSHRRILQHTSCAQQKCHPVRLERFCPIRGGNGLSMLNSAQTANISACTPGIHTKIGTTCVFSKNGFSC